MEYSNRQTNTVYSSRYVFVRTQLCKYGDKCHFKQCTFAHHINELRKDKCTLCPHKTCFDVLCVFSHSFGEHYKAHFEFIDKLKIHTNSQYVHQVGKQTMYISPLFQIKIKQIKKERNEQSKNCKYGKRCHNAACKDNHRSYTPLHRQ